VPLNCLTIGQSHDNILSVDICNVNTIDRSQINIDLLKVSNLKKLVLEAAKYKLNDVVDPDSLKLWKVELRGESLDESSNKVDGSLLEDENQIEELLKLLEGRKMGPMEKFRIKDNFPKDYEPKDNHVHIIVVLPLLVMFYLSKKDQLNLFHTIFFS